MYIDEGGGSAPIPSMTESMDRLAESAASGGFAISETGGKALIQAIQHLAEWVDGQRANLDYLATEPPLGNSVAARAMKPYVADVAAGGQGFITMLLEFRKSLSKAEKALNDAMRNYKTNEEAAAASLRIQQR